MHVCREQAVIWDFAQLCYKDLWYDMLFCCCLSTSWFDLLCILRYFSAHHGSCQPVWLLSSNIFHQLGISPPDYDSQYGFLFFVYHINCFWNTHTSGCGTNNHARVTGITIFPILMWTWAEAFMHCAAVNWVIKWVSRRTDVPTKVACECVSSGLVVITAQGCTDTERAGSSVGNCTQWTTFIH